MSDFYAHLEKEVKEHEASKEIHNMEQRKAVTDHDHFFRLVRGNEIQCSCGWGLILDANDEFREGHLYKDGTLIV